MVKNLLRRVPGARRLARFLGLAHQQLHRREFLLEMLPKNSVCAEIGVHEGTFAAHILQTVQPNELHLVDPWKYEESEPYRTDVYGEQTDMDDRYEAVRLRFEPDISAGRVKIHRDYSGNVLGEFRDGYFDWIYLDGNHFYEFVRQDLELSFEKIKPGGYIAGDDYREGGWMKGGVKKAVDEFIQEKPVHVVVIRKYQFVLRK